MLRGELREAFDALPVGAIVLDATGRVVVYNRYEEHLARRRRENVLGRDFFHEVAPCMNVPELGGAFRAGIGSGELDAEVELSFPLRFGTLARDVLVRMRPLLLDGAPHAVIVVEDVSHRLAVDRLKAALTRLLVHDLKNPLAAVLANLSVVQQLGTHLPPAQRTALDEAAEDAIAASNRLERMILDLLDVARLETSTMPVARAPVLLEELVSTCLRDGAAVARLREVELVADVERDASGLLDTALMRRAVGNLVENALRHAPRGSRVVVRGRREGGAAILEVADRGPGIPPELSETVFETFVQVGSHARGANRGLGLTFVRLAARAHGGEASVTTRPEHGSTFRIAVPDAHLAPLAR